MRWFLYLSLFLIFFKNLYGGRIIQLKDFLCGCEYCETVNAGEPLDIGRHMIMCYSWRDSTMKTMQVMEAMKKEKELTDKYGIPIEETLPSYAVPNRKDIQAKEIIVEEPKTIHNDYSWKEDDLHGWSYSTTAQHILNHEGWIYSENLEWIWSFGEERNFVYSMDYGWLYAMRFKSYRILYWYDKRIWMLASSFPLKHLKHL